MSILKQTKIKNLYQSLYPNCEASFKELEASIVAHKSRRSSSLKTRDKKGVRWLQESETVGMVLYVDLFSDDLKGLVGRIPYLKALGITLLHLMPILEPRAGENDGGYAVKNYRQIDPKLGGIADFEALIKQCHKDGIRLCIDYVVNHTADDHQWAMCAKAGDEKYQQYYFMHDSFELVQAFESHLEQVFPKVAPGNFTYLQAVEKWVMTTFYPFQWDLNYQNPQVFHAMVENLMFLANCGVDMIRLDAIPYMWKQLGTNCRNLPEVHTLLALFREICDFVAPSLALLGEAIMAPDVITRYFGATEQLECHTLYNASYMVEIWNALATRDARHIAMMPIVVDCAKGTWINYARCHDDIGWGLDSHKTQQMGFEPEAHKSFLIDFYLGSLPESFAIGELYEFDTVTMDARNSGALGSFAGLERALATSDHYQIELAIKRILLVHALILFKSGIPMLYSGDELAQLNDYSYKKDDHKARDSRWLHRPFFDWNRLEILENNQRDMSALAMRAVYQGVVDLIRMRKTLWRNQLITQEEVMHISNDHVLALHLTPGKILLCNLSEDRQWVYTNGIKRYGFRGIWQEKLQGKVVDFESEKLLLGPYEINIFEKK